MDPDHDRQNAGPDLIQTDTDSVYHFNQIFDKGAGAGASSTSVGPFPGNWLTAA